MGYHGLSNLPPRAFTTFTTPLYEVSRCCFIFPSLKAFSFCHCFLHAVLVVQMQILVLCSTYLNRFSLWQLFNHIRWASILRTWAALKHLTLSKVGVLGFSIIFLKLNFCSMQYIGLSSLAWAAINKVDMRPKSLSIYYTSAGSSCTPDGCCFFCHTIFQFLSSPKNFLKMFQSCLY